MKIDCVGSHCQSRASLTSFKLVIIVTNREPPVMLHHVSINTNRCHMNGIR